MSEKMYNVCTQYSSECDEKFSLFEFSEQTL
jgi:hypothetical protein